MACADKTLLVHAYLDGELDLVRSLEFEEHLKTCASCAQELRSQQTLRNALRSSNLYTSAPQGLEKRLRANLPAHTETQTKTSAAVPVPIRPAASPDSRESVRPRRSTLEWLAVAAAILIVVALALKFSPGFARRQQSELLAQEIVASHIRSLQPGHLLDIQSTDQHTVKPWFNGRVDFSPPVRDLADQGFPLIGGRLDYLDHRTVAALVYQRRKHIITVFIWPTDSAATPPKSISRDGYNVVSWSNSGMNFCAVSDVNLAELRQFAQRLEH